MSDRDLMQQALKALETNQPVNYCMNNNGEKFPMMQEDPFRFDRNTKAIAALRERLAQPEQQPVAHTLNCVCGAVWDIKADGSEQMAHTPDTTPPQRMPLTEKRIEELYSFWVVDCQDIVGFARAVERTVKGEV